MRSTALSVGIATAILLLAGCGGSEKNNGTLPVGEGSDDQPTVTLSTPGPKASTSSTPPVKTAAPPQTAKLTVVAGNYGAIPAVQGLVENYPLYFQALVSGNEDLIKTSFPAYFYADTAINLQAAKGNGWVMRPPASVVVVGTKSQPAGLVQVNLCRSQTTQYWNPKTKRWVVTAPHGTPQAIDMVRTGLGWTMYRMTRPMPKGIDCSKVHYPA